MQKLTVVLGVLVVALGAGGIYCWMCLDKRPGTPEMFVLGKPLDVIWQDIPGSDLRGPSWSAWPLKRLNAGNSTKEISTWTSPTDRHSAQMAKTTQQVPAPSVKGNPIRNQELFRLSVPDALGHHGGHLGWQINVDGEVTDDESEYSIRFLEAGGVSQDHFLVFKADFDDTERVLQVQIGWAFPDQNTGRTCSLRYRLTSQGFELAQPEDMK